LHEFLTFFCKKIFRTELEFSQLLFGPVYPYTYVSYDNLATDNNELTSKIYRSTQKTRPQRQKSQ